MISRRILRQITRGHLARLVSEPVPFSYPISDSGLSFVGHQMSIYAPEFTPCCKTLSDGSFILVQNTYLTSFVADCVSVWMAEPESSDCKYLIRYNLKKFYAEQILARADVAFGRALLLETLLFEETKMRDFVESRVRSTELESHYQGAIDISSSILLLHELGHMAQRTVPDFGRELVQALPCSAVTDSWPKPTLKSREDFEADAFATCMTWAQGADGMIQKLGIHVFLKLLVLCHSFLSCMNSLAICAEITAEDLSLSEDQEDQQNFFGEMAGAEFKLGIHPLYDKRYRSTFEIIANLAEQESIDFASLETPQGAITNTIDTLYNHIDDILGGETSDYRGKCEMLARAFQGHKSGFEYLIWRSKTFKFPSERQ